MSLCRNNGEPHWRIASHGIAPPMMANPCHYDFRSLGSRRMAESQHTMIWYINLRCLLADPDNQQRLIKNIDHYFPTLFSCNGKHSQAQAISNRLKSKRIHNGSHFSFHHFSGPLNWSVLKHGFIFYDRQKPLSTLSFLSRGGRSTSWCQGIRRDHPRLDSRWCWWILWWCYWRYSWWAR